MRLSILGLCIVLAATPALADDRAKAKQLYDEGLRHFNVAEYPQAIETWKQAYLMAKKPLLLFNIAQAYRLSGDCSQAMRFYDNYQNAEPTPKNQDELDQAIAACKAAASKPPDVKPVDTKPTDTKPADTKPATKPEITPAITTPQVPDTQTPVTPVPTGPVETRPPVPPPVATTTTTTTSTGRGRTIGMIVGIAGVVFEGGAVVFALQGKAKARDAENVSTWNPHAMDLQSSGQLDNKLAWGLGIAGGAAIAAGVVLYVTGGASAEHGVAIVPTRHGAQLGWAHSF
jgi:tetratricopeptide (TPR) repeat protein